MSSPRLPTHTGDTWECSFLFESARDVRTVSGRGGLVVAGGQELHLLRPGAQNMASRPPPLDIGPIFVAAAEPRAPFRYAVASEEMVAVFYRSKDGDQLLRMRCPPSGPSATHLAWGHTDGSSTLYILWNDGVVARLNQDLSGAETIELPPIDAIAADNAGVLAMASFSEPTPRVYVGRDGENFSFRPLPPDFSVEPSQHLYLTVADMAVAFAVEDGGAFLSRSPDDPFMKVEPLATAGAIDFEGASRDAALFGATHHAGIASIIRVDREGTAVRIADFGSDGGAPPEIIELAWDASRDMVWGASPQMGLVTCTAPSAKRGKKAPLS
jgi:hypothetical protein